MKIEVRRAMFIDTETGEVTTELVPVEQQPEQQDDNEQK